MLLRHCRLDHAEDDVCDYERHENIESLSGKEYLERHSVLFAEDILESGFKSDADKGDTEQCVLESLGHGTYALRHFFRKRKAEYEGCQYHTYHEFRESLPDYAGCRSGIAVRAFICPHH